MNNVKRVPTFLSDLIIPLLMDEFNVISENDDGITGCSTQSALCTIQRALIYNLLRIIYSPDKQRLLRIACHSEDKRSVKDKIHFILGRY